MLIPRRKDRVAFTILELALALAALALVAVVGIWAFFARGEVTLESAARLLRQDLQLAQARASRLGEPVDFVFHEDGGGYHVEDVQPSPPVTDPDGTRRYPIDGVFEDVRILRVQSPDPWRVRFDPVGVAAADSWITLQHRRQTRTLHLRRGVAGIVVLDG